MMRQWHEIYRAEWESRADIPRFIEKKIGYKRTFIDRIASNCPPDGQLVEVGAGSGTVAVHLAARGYNSTIVDSSTEMLLTARAVRDAIGVDMKIINADLRHLPFPDNSFDVIYSHGVMEHFCDADIEKILRHHLRIAPTVVFAVPSAQYTEKHYGDERFMRWKPWTDLIRRSGHITEVFGYNHAPNTWQRITSRFRLDNNQFLGFVVHRN